MAKLMHSGYDFDVTHDSDGCTTHVNGAGGTARITVRKSAILPSYRIDATLPDGSGHGLSADTAEKAIDGVVKLLTQAADKPNERDLCGEMEEYVKTLE